jgi:hypothetical protein
MALKYPLANGNWSTAANWNGGTLPVAGDDVRANGFTVTIDVDINVLQISTNALAPAAAGGSFVVSINRTLICDIYAGTTTCLTSSVGITVNIIGNIYGGTGFAIFAVTFSNVGSVLNVTGNAFAPIGGGGAPHGLNSSGTVNFVGNANAGAGSPSGGAAINITATGSLTFTGIATGGSGVAGSFGILCTGNSTLNGTINGGANAISFGVRLNGGTHTVNSDCYGSGVAGSHACVVSTSTATFNGNIFGSTSSTSFGLQVLDTASNVVISTMTFSTNGGMPVNGFVKFKNTAPTVTVRKANNTNQTLVDPLTTDIPVIGNVRDGITYASGSLTGTLKVPSPLNVALGVPTDNTVGSGIITIANMGTLLASFKV